MTVQEFQPWPKIARLNRDIVITEKIDGTNAAIGVLADCCDLPEDEHGGMLTIERGHNWQRAAVYAQSRTRIITPEQDNFGFAAWVRDHAKALAALLGPGLHFGEWWGLGIQRGYGLPGKRFSLFNTARWGFLNDPDYLATQPRPIVHCVPVLYEGPFEGINSIERPWDGALDTLRRFGSAAAPGFMKPEGIVVYHTAARTQFKVTLEGDEQPKSSSRSVE